MNAVIQALLDLVVDLGTKPGQASEGGLDVATGAAEPVVKIEVTKGGIKVVAPHQPDDPSAEPHAFGIARRTIDNLGGFGEFVGLALVILGGICRAGCRLAGLILRGGRSALGKGGTDADRQDQPGDGEGTQNRNPKLIHSLAHIFPELVPAHVFPPPMPSK